MATLRQIAQKTRLSISVVSRVLNPRPDKNARVAPATRARVLETAQSLGYRHNRAAEFLKRGKMPSIGVFLPAMPNRLIADLVFGLSEASAEQDFPLSFSFSLTLQGYRHYLEHAADWAHCGIITYPYQSPDRKLVGLIETFRREGGNLVLLNAFVTPTDVPVVAMDDYEGGRLAAQRLLDRGCKDFVHLGRYPGRNQGFQETLAAAGAQAEWLPADQTGLAEIKQRAANYQAKAPLGVFAMTDIDAMRVMAALRRSPCEIGRELLLIGYDDLYQTPELSPPLTSIHQPFKELGRVAVQKIVNMIYGKPEESAQVKPYLVARQTA